MSQADFSDTPHRPVRSVDLRGNAEFIGHQKVGGHWSGTTAFKSRIPRPTKAIFALRAKIAESREAREAGQARRAILAD